MAGLLHFPKEDGSGDFYDYVMENERMLFEFMTGRPDLGAGAKWRNFGEMKKAVRQAAEVAKGSLVPRGYLKSYGLGAGVVRITGADNKEYETIFESVGAHTNLVTTLTTLALRRQYGAHFGDPHSENVMTTDGYYFPEILEAVRIHDLPENFFGDIPDDGTGDADAKACLETNFFDSFERTYPDGEAELAARARKLFREVSKKSSPTGRLVYSADKASAVFNNLVLDLMELLMGGGTLYPRKSIDDPTNTNRDRLEIAACEDREGEWVRGSEMWTVDYFLGRKLVQYDDTGFFTALIVAATLMIHGKWWQWRVEDYEQRAV